MQKQILPIRTLFCAMMLTMALPMTSVAQDVTLRFANGQDSISGTLNEFKDGKFFVNASIGLVAIPTDGVSCIGDACPDETRLKLENANVVLASRDGTASIAGDLIEVENNVYVIATSVGEQRIPADLVNCSGDGCPMEPADRSVQLTNGGLTLTGTLIGLAENAYILDDAVMGEIRVSAREFECSGPGCP